MSSVHTLTAHASSTARICPTRERAHVPAAFRRQTPPVLRPYSGGERLLSLLAPAVCALCDGPVSGVQEPICAQCEAAITWRRTRVDFGEVWSPFEHAGLARRAVTRLKYYGERWRGFQLAQYAALSWFSVFEHDIDADDLLIPIPLTTRRLRSRGFNQAQVLTRGICQRVQLRTAHGVLTRPASRQVDQKQRNRAQRLHAANPFRARAAAKNAGTRVWIVDDVITTGSTLQQAALRLREADYQPVGAITLNWTC